MDITEKPEVLSLFDTRVAPRYSPKPLKIIWPCHPLALVIGGQYDTIKITSRPSIASGNRGAQDLRF